MNKLHAHLKAARLKSGLTLREVEKRSKKKNMFVSNGYLSQLENGVVTDPSPFILRSVCTVLEIDYITAMMAAGYLKKGDFR